MVQQIHNIQKIPLSLTVLHRVLFCLLCYRWSHILKTVLCGHFLCIRDSIHHISFYIAYIFNTLYGLYTTWKELKQLQHQDQPFQQPKTGNPLVQISPPPDEFFTEVREQLIIPSFTKQIPSIQDIQQDPSNSQVFESEHLLLLHSPNIFIELTYSPPVICND